MHNDPSSQHEPWGQSHRPTPPPEPPRKKRPRRKRSGFGLFLMLVGLVTICLLIFRFLVIPLLVNLKGGM